MGRRPYPCRVLPQEPLEKEALDTTWSTKYGKGETHESRLSF